MKSSSIASGTSARLALFAGGSQYDDILSNAAMRSPACNGKFAHIDEAGAHKLSPPALFRRREMMPLLWPRIQNGALASMRRPMTSAMPAAIVIARLQSRLYRHYLDARRRRR